MSIEKRTTNTKKSIFRSVFVVAAQRTLEGARCKIWAVLKACDNGVPAAVFVAFSLHGALN